MGSFISTVIGMTGRDRATPENQQEYLIQRTPEASFSSPSDMDPPGLTDSDSLLNMPTENTMSGRIQFYSLANLPLENNFLNPFFYGFLGPEDNGDLQALAGDNGQQSEFFVVTNELPDFSDIFMASNQVRAVLLPAFDGELNDGLQAGISWFSAEFQGGGSMIFKFELCRVDDGTISDSVMGHIVSEELVQTEYFDNFEDRMRREGHIRFFVCTRDQLRNPLVVIFLQKLCISHANLPVYLYEAQTPGMSDEEAAEILGSSMSWIEGSEGGEIDCAICLDSIERGDEVKALACKHVYHYACILRSTKRKQQCPICRATYDCRTAQ
ncbi:hypothetical protein SUGI_0216650 [Cryptomeria japonica]|nr:hypothetical protein SUGI_0216650 [Cryptomeria japonica]